MKDTIRAIDSKCYGSDGEPKDSVDQDTYTKIIFSPSVVTEGLIMDGGERP